MVHKRVAYLQQTIDSLRRSDFPRDVPLIISHDGQVPEMVAYVHALKPEFQVIQLFHPHSCYDFPQSFPGNDLSLNQNYTGDQYGNPRSDWATCAKHHFTWLLKQVFSLKALDGFEDFLLSEEDYELGPSVYSTLVQGLEFIRQLDDKDAFWGVGLDTLEARAKDHGAFDKPDPDSYFAAHFQTSPMTMNRHIFQKLQARAADYCQFDDYNWDWSLVHR